MKVASSRLFKNNFMEACTHVHPIVPFLLWFPFCIYLLSFHFSIHDSLSALLIKIIFGFFTWTLFEYCFHRFAFHLKSNNPILQYLTFLIHGIHHKEPRDKTRLVMPPAPALIIGALLFGILLVLHIPWSFQYAFGAGFTLGYLAYDYSHYFLHHANFRSQYYHALKRHHMHHHFKEIIALTLEYPRISGTWYFEHEKKF